MPTLLELTSQGDVGTMTDESKLSQVVLMDPQQLYELWERQPWSAHAIDLEQDKADWAALSEERRSHISWLLSSFFVGEERVTTQFTGLVATMKESRSALYFAASCPLRSNITAARAESGGPSISGPGTSGASCCWARPIPPYPP